MAFFSQKIFFGGEGMYFWNFCGCIFWSSSCILYFCCDEQHITSIKDYQTELKKRKALHHWKQIRSYINANAIVSYWKSYEGLTFDTEHEYYYVEFENTIVESPSKALLNLCD